MSSTRSNYRAEAAIIEKSQDKFAQSRAQATWNELESWLLDNCENVSGLTADDRDMLRGIIFRRFRSNA